MNPQHSKETSLSIIMEEGDKANEQHPTNAESAASLRPSQNPNNSSESSKTLLFECLFVIFIGPFLLLYWMVVLPFITLLPATLAVPLLLVALVVTRLLQFIRSGDGFDKTIQLKYIILTFIFLATLEILFAMGIFYPIAQHGSTLKHVKLLGLPLTKWVSVTCMICGFYSFTYCLALFVHKVLGKILDQMHIVRSIYVREAVSDIINCLIFWWAVLEVMKRVPAFAQHQVLGLQTWKWIVVATFTLIGYNTITLFTRVSVWLLRERFRALDRADKPPAWYFLVEKLLPRKHVLYCAYGMRRSISFILNSLLLLLIWVLYFGSNLKGTVAAKRVLDLGSWTFVSLLVLSILWLIKNCLLLSWEATAIYNRLYSKILENGKQLYFLGLLGRHEYDIFALLYNEEEKENGLIVEITHFVLEVIGLHNKHQRMSDEADVWGAENTGVNQLPNSDAEHPDGYQMVSLKRFSSRKRKIIEEDLLLPKSCSPALDHIQRMAQHLLTAKDALSGEKYTSDILAYLKSKNPSGDSNWLEVDDLKKLMIINCDKNDENDASQVSSRRNSLKKSKYGMFFKRY